MRDERGPSCCGRNNLALSEKYMLTIHEASAYFGIGLKTLRRMAENNEGSFALLMGNRFLIVRHKFETYIDELIEHGKGGITDEESGFEQQGYSESE